MIEPRRGSGSGGKTHGAGQPHGGECGLFVHIMEERFLAQVVDHENLVGDPKDKTTRRREGVLPQGAGTSCPYTLRAEKKSRILIPGRNMVGAIFVQRSRKSCVSPSFLPEGSFTMVFLAFLAVDPVQHRAELLLEDLNDSPVLHVFRDETAGFSRWPGPLKQSMPT